MGGGHREEIVCSTLASSAAMIRAMLRSISPRSEELVRIRTVAMAHEIRALVVQQKKVCNTVFAERLVLDHGDHRIGLEGGEER